MGIIQQWFKSEILLKCTPKIESRFIVEQYSLQG